MNPVNPVTTSIAAPTVEEIAPGVTIEWLNDRRIVVGTMDTSQHNQAMRGWHQWILATIRDWPAEKPFLLLIDPSKNPVWTPQMREQSEELRRHAEARLKGRVAVVVPAPSFVVTAMNMFIRSGRNKIPSRLFDTREKALAWLEEYLRNQ